MIARIERAGPNWMEPTERIRIMLRRGRGPTFLNTNYSLEHAERFRLSADELSGRDTPDDLRPAWHKRESTTPKSESGKAGSAEDAAGTK